MRDLVEAQWRCPRILLSPTKVARARAGTEPHAQLHVPKTLGTPQYVTHRRDGVDRVEDGEEQDVVDAPGIICVPRAGYLLASGVINKGRVTSNVDLVVGCIINSIAGAKDILKLHQGLPLLGHHHHIAGMEKATVRPTPQCRYGDATTACVPQRVPSPDGSKLLQGLHKIGLHDTIDQPPNVHHRGGRRLVGVIIVLLAGEKGSAQYGAHPEPLRPCYFPQNYPHLGHYQEKTALDKVSATTGISACPLPIAAAEGPTLAVKGGSCFELGATKEPPALLGDASKDPAGLCLS